MKDQENTFRVESISDAAWLEGVCNVECLRIDPHPTKRGKYLFLFNISEEEGRMLLLRFGSSQAFKFDASVKNLKGRLFRRKEKDES